MTDPEKLRLNAILKEHLQSYILLGFDLEGNFVRGCDFETELQGMAIAEAVRCERNQNAQAPEVWVRNYKKTEEAE